MPDPLRYFIASGCPIATTTRYRCIHLREQLQALGHTARVVEWFEETKMEPDDALGYDVIILYRLAMCPPLERLIADAKRQGKPVIFDTDDLIFEPELTSWHRAVKALNERDQAQYLKGVRGYLATLLASDAVTVATSPLAELAGQRGRPAFVHRNALGREMEALAGQLYRERQSRRPNDNAVIGYGSGTATHDIDFKEATGALLGILERFPKVELWIAGPLVFPRELERLDNRVRHYPITDWPEWFRLMSRMDIALAPLEMNNIFCRAKSEIKFFEAGALGLPVVATNIDPYRDSVTNGVDGFLAANEDDWLRALTALVEDPQLRNRLGQEARRTVLQKYSPRARTLDLAAILPALLGDRFG